MAKLVEVLIFIVTSVTLLVYLMFFEFADISTLLEQVVNFGVLLHDCTHTSPYSDELQELLFHVANMIELIEEVNDEEVRVRARSGTGRPSVLVEEKTLCFFVENCFQVQDMALTLYRLIYLSVIRELKKVCAFMLIHSPTDPKLGSFSRNRMPLPGHSWLLRNCLSTSVRR